MLVEPVMMKMYTLLNNQVTIFTMDHRGTGRSGRLDCKAAQATMPGSPGGTTITLDETTECLSDLAVKFG